MKLQLGCGVRPSPGFVNHDRIQHAQHVDVAHDLNVTPWPWPSESAEYIQAFDVMEHLKVDVQVWLDECWRILEPGGRLHLRLPAWDNPVSWRDPTHRRVFHEETFDFWDRSTQLWRDYGHFYFAESDKWWTIKHVGRCNPSGFAVPSDLCFSLHKA